ncbi:uncharacterized protein LOC142246482 [Anomaloglossus baeobatrachus]|uniref:uncharacterized protein LOC142246482 n=1 Tax=Anomaloglossus baeobatrachus TaxID=238106 RepID=UPI003F4F52D3
MYKCSVIYGLEMKEKEVRLDIGIPPQVTVTKKTVVVNVESVLRCSATGFYPVDIDIKWFKDGEKLNGISTEDPRRNPDGTFSVDSTVTIIPTEEDREQIFSCRVYHDFLQEPLETDFRLVYEDRSSAGIIAACSVLAVILIIIITAGVLWWRQKLNKRKDKGPLTVGDIVAPPKLIAGEEAVLYCTVYDAPEDLCVTWLISRAGEEQEIQTSQMRGHPEEEEESLLDTSYVIRSQREGRQYSSSLSFIPHMERHKDATFICRGVSGHQKDEKTFHRKRIYGKPQMSAPIHITMEDYYSSRVQFSLNLQTFYPKDINISWLWKDTAGEYLLSPKETISTRDNNATYEVSNVVWIPGDQFTDPEMKIIVKWEHESLKTPETRTVTIRDLPWRPHVGDIRVPELEDGRAATLTCDISRYFPDLLSVFWFTKKDGNITALPRDSKTDRKYKMSENEKRQKDHTYSCEASVTFTPIISSDEGSEIICRVEHPSEEHPIERSTGPLHIDEKKPSYMQSMKDSIAQNKIVKTVIRVKDAIISNKNNERETGESPESRGTGESPESRGTGESPESRGTGEDMESTRAGETPESTRAGETPESTGTGEDMESTRAGEDTEKTGTGESLKSKGESTAEPDQENPQVEEQESTEGK